MINFFFYMKRMRAEPYCCMHIPYIKLYTMYLLQTLRDGIDWRPENLQTLSNNDWDQSGSEDKKLSEP
jgi:hypothetical protein